MILSILPNWQELSLLQQIYWAIAIPSTLVFIFILITTIVGSEVGVDVDTDMDTILADGDSIPFQFLSLKNIIGFFTMFGWSGLGFIDLGWSYLLVISLSFVCGFLMMVAMAAIFYFMSKLTESGTLNLNNAVGKIGGVYLTIPASRSGFGKVQITIQGSLETLDAMTDDEFPISTGAIISVVSIIDQQILLVTKN
ncbi:hypothetical protein [Mangrovibacterium lignilyticum]|uniref:hypothetical protein n=1 Tax=Mangrovibacterium lignilyticum TaxID=2668052 RepID=UPI0013CF5001|nr:hypothetical protein [Mangrovibacterium lignilyticum]